MKKASPSIRAGFKKTQAIDARVYALLLFGW
jgi:hypothetical protein